MKTASEIRAMQEEELEEYLIERRLKEEQENERELAEIEALIIKESSEDPTVGHINYFKNILGTPIAEELFKAGYEIVIYPIGAYTTGTMIKW